MLIAIDFGTSFSQVSTIYLDQPLMLHNPGEYGLPSEFYYDTGNGILIGQDALDAGQGEAAKNLVSEVKMALQPGRTFCLDGRVFPVEEIVCGICREAIRNGLNVAQRYALNPNIEQVVLSIPAKFSIRERRIIHDAVRKCLGNQTVPLRIIKEPVAAALRYYDTGLSKDDYVLVYDLGGGTCDIALVKADPSRAEHYTVIDSDMVRLGGRNWDDALIHYLSIMLKQAGVSVTGNPAYEEKIRRAAIAVKHDLSNPEKSRAVARIEINGKVHTVPITRSTFDEITRHLLEQTLECIQQVHFRNVAECPVKEIICVGGSSNMPQVAEGLRRVFPDCNVRVLEPQHAVIHGAAIYARLRTAHVTDVSSFSYGIDSYDPDTNRNVISNVITRGSPLPARGTRYYRPRKGQKAMRFCIYESEFSDDQYDLEEENKAYIGFARLELPANAAENLSVTCEFILNTNGMLEVRAFEPSGNSVNTSILLDDV